MRPHCMGDGAAVGTVAVVDAQEELGGVLRIRRQCRVRILWGPMVRGLLYRESDQDKAVE